MTIIHFVNAQNNWLGLEFAETPIVIECPGSNPICKLKVRIKKPNGGGEVHVFASLGARGDFDANDYHEHPHIIDDSLQVMEIEFIASRVRSNDLISVQMYYETQPGQRSDSKIFWGFPTPPVYSSTLNPVLVVKAAKDPIGCFSLWSTFPTITSTSSFDLTYNNPFWINLYSSTEMSKYRVSIRHNNSGITNSMNFDFLPIYGNPCLTKEDISNMFVYQYFPQSNKRQSYTVFISALNCQGNIEAIKSFQVSYTGRRLFEQSPDNIYRD